MKSGFALREQLRKMLESYQQKNVEKPAFLGDKDGNLLVGSNPYFMHARLSDGTPLQVWNYKTLGKWNDPVWIGHDEDNPNNLVVVRSRTVFQYPPNAGVPYHEHDLGGRNPAWVWAPQFMPWLVVPTMTANTVEVHKNTLYINDEYIPGEVITVDLTSSVPTSGARYALLQLGIDGETITVKNGDIEADFSITPTIPLPDTNCVPLAAVRLYFGQTQILYGDPRTTDVVDLRGFGITGGSGGSPQTPYRVLLSDADGLTTTLPGVSYNPSTGGLQLGEDENFNAGEGDVQQSAPVGQSPSNLRRAYGSGGAFAQDITYRAFGNKSAKLPPEPGVHLWARYAGAWDGLAWVIGATDQMHTSGVWDEHHHGTRRLMYVTPEGYDAEPVPVMINPDGSIDLPAGTTFNVGGVPHSHVPGETGENIIINGGFDADTDWDKGSGTPFVISLGTAHGAGATGILSQTIPPFVVGKQYLVRFHLSTSGGTLRVQAAGETSIDYDDTNSWGHDLELISGFDGGNIEFVPVGSWTGTIDDVSAVELYPNMISNDVYGESWDGDTTHAPSKDAVYDKIESMGSSNPQAKTLFDHYADAGNVGSGYTSLYLDTLDAGQFANNGDKVEIVYGGISTPDEGSPVDVQLKVGGSAIFYWGPSNLSSVTYWKLSVLLIRVDATTLRFVVSGEFGDTHNAVTSDEYPDITLSGAIDIELFARADTATNNQVVVKLGTAMYIPDGFISGGGGGGGGGGSWGSITGTLADQTDLQTALDAKESTANKNAAGGYAGLDGSGKVAAAQLPSYVDDVIEAANYAALPGTGETGKIYVTIDDNTQYRWTGSVYVAITASPGTTDDVTEGSTNLYFTVARVRSTVLTGLSLVTSQVIAATDTILQALGYLQAQITAIPSVAAAIHAAAGKTTPVDADELGLADSAASFAIKKLTWANLKATLAAYFDARYTYQVVSVNFNIDGGASVILTGLVKGNVQFDFACTIVSVTLLANQSGSIVVDIWKDTYANYPPTVADTITASAKPTISSATKSQDTTLTGWNTTISAGDILKFNVDSVTSIQSLTVVLKVQRS